MLILMNVLKKKFKQYLRKLRYELTRVPKQNDPNILFIAIPKTASRSIRQELKKT